MESGLTRFVILVMMFYILTGDLAGIMKTLFKDKGKSKQQQQQPRAAGAGGGGNTQSAVAPPVVDVSSSSSSAAAAAGAPEGAADPDLEAFAKSYSARMKLVNTIKESCLPKLICELTASTNQDTLTESERYLLSLIRETTISMTAEVTSKYHFAAHMGQLINGIDNTGCHNFYPGCPFPGLQVMQMMKKVKIL